MTGSESGGRLLSIPLVVHGGEEFPAEVDLEPSGRRYVGFYENQYGEQLVFVHEEGSDPILYHGDCGWKPIPAEWPQISSLSPLVSPWVTGDVILNQGEVLWLASCLHASGALRDEEAAVSDPIERFALEIVQTGGERRRKHLDRQWSLRVVALERWREGQQKAPPEEEDHYAEGAILVALGLNKKQRRPRPGVSKGTRDRIEQEAAEVVREVQSADSSAKEK